jgi:hypothetical protein
MKIDNKKRGIIYRLTKKELIRIFNKNNNKEE